MAALGIEEINAEGLIRACEALYNAQNDRDDGIFVVSHCDIHTGNLVTLLTGTDPVSKLKIPSITKFGVIDWSDIMIDRHFSDPTNFWVHHLRKALSACGEYNYGFDGLAEAYQQEFELKGTEYGLRFGVVDSKRDALIQSVLWNIYEMYDPVRSNSKDIEEKAVVHCRLLLGDLRQLEYYGYGEQANTIRDELETLLEEHSYLLPVFNS